MVEKAFNDYANNSDRVVESTNHVYYDAKSPKTFCDTAQLYDQNRNAKQSGKQAVVNKTSAKTTTRASTSATWTEEASKVNKRANFDEVIFNLGLKTQAISNPLEIQFNVKNSELSDAFHNDGLVVQDLGEDSLNELSQSEKDFYVETGTNNFFLNIF